MPLFLALSIALNVASATSSIPPETGTLPLFGLFETNLPVTSADTAGVSNPFNTDEIAVDALIATPRGDLTHPCFFYVPCTRSYTPFGESRRIVAIPAENRGVWKLRYTPMVTGEHRIRVRIRTKSGERFEDAGSIQVVASENPGFIRRRERGFFYDNGRRYHPIGYQQAWSQAMSRQRAYYNWGNGRDSIDGFEWFYGQSRLYGANWNRMWIDCADGRGGAWAHPTPQTRSGSIDYGEAWMLDQIMQSAEKNGIGIQLMIGRYVQPVPEYAKYLRYLCARWGYSTAIFAWELKNENWWKNHHGYEDEELWTKDMTAILREADPYDHLITTSHWEDAVKDKAPIYRQENIDFYSDHKYFQDKAEVRIWREAAGSPHASTEESHSPPSSMRMFPRCNTVHGPDLAVEEGASLNLKFWYRTKDLKANRVAVVARFLDQNNKLVGDTLEARIPADGSDWTEMNLPVKVPREKSIGLMKLYIEQAGLDAGEVFIDDLSVADGEGRVLYYEAFSWDREPELSMIRRIFNRGRWLEAFRIDKPLIGGEHGLKRDVNDRPFRSPYVHGIDETGRQESRVTHAWDRKGQHAREWLWAAAMSWDGATAMWWWVADSLKHTLPLRMYVDNADEAFYSAAPASSWGASPGFKLENKAIQACGRVSPEHVYAFVFHSDSTWERAIAGGITPEPATGVLRVASCKPGTWRIRWFDTHYADVKRETSPVVNEETLNVAPDGEMSIKVVNLSGDIALMADLQRGGGSN